MDEWTSADTGVGAAIASGNHATNGYCALLVIAAIVIIIVVTDGEYIISLHILVILQCP